MTDSTPDAVEISEKELDLLEGPNRKIAIPRTGSNRKHGGKKSRGKSIMRGKHKTKGKGKKKIQMLGKQQEHMARGPGMGKIAS